MISVAVVDDHRIFIDAFELYANKEPDIQLVGSTERAGGILDLVRQATPDILLLDVFLPDGNGLDYIAQVKTISPKTRIVVFTGYVEDQNVLRAVEAGAEAFVPKSWPMAKLTATLRQVMDGELVLPANMLASLLNQQSIPGKGNGHSHPEWDRLTGRELEILRMLSAGKSGCEIAEHLSIAPLTVRTHIRNMMVKLGAHTRLEAVILGHKLGLV